MVVIFLAYYKVLMKLSRTRQVSSMIHSAKHCFLCFVVLDLKSGDGRTDNTCENNYHYWPWLWVGRVDQQKETFFILFGIDMVKLARVLMGFTPALKCSSEKKKKVPHTSKTHIDPSCVCPKVALWAVNLGFCSLGQKFHQAVEGL